MIFIQAVNLILSYEGGYVNHSHDPGGATNYGISQRAYPELDIENLTREGAMKIYLKDYWLKVRADKLPQDLRLMVFDCAVNQGVSTARKTLQKVLGVKVDGIIGPITLKAAETTPTVLTIDKFAMERLKLYTGLRTWEHFGKGWSKRLLEVSLLSAFSVTTNSVPSLEQN